MKKLWRCEITKIVEVCVYADDEDDAEAIALTEGGRLLTAVEHEIDTVYEVENAKQIPEGWATTPPLMGEDVFEDSERDMTCLEHATRIETELKEAIALEEHERRQGKLWPKEDQSQ